MEAETFAIVATLAFLFQTLLALSYSRKRKPPKPEPTQGDVIASLFGVKEL